MHRFISAPKGLGVDICYYLFGHCSLVLCFDIRCCDSPSLVLSACDCHTAQDLFWFQMDFSITFSLKNNIGVWVGIALCSMDIVQIFPFDYSKICFFHWFLLVFCYFHYGDYSPLQHILRDLFYKYFWEIIWIRLLSWLHSSIWYCYETCYWFCFCMCISISLNPLITSNTFSLVNILGFSIHKILLSANIAYLLITLYYLNIFYFFPT